jgi:PAS domain S-box-containing protein
MCDFVVALNPSSSVQSSQRLDALIRSGLLDSEAEPRFDRLTALVREMLGVPTALISLVDDERQFFKSCLGLAEPWASQRETPLSHSFCQYVVHEAKPLLIEDARAHAVLRHNGAVRDMGVVAYAGMPIRDGDGMVLGSLCAIDVVPRAWTEREITLLEALAAAVSSEIALQRQATIALALADASYREVVDALDEVVFRADADARWTWLSPAWTRLTGFAVEESLGSAVWNMLADEHRAGAAQRIRAFLGGELDALRKSVPFQRADGTTAWVDINARVTYDETGRVNGMLGTFNDATRRVEEQRILQDTRDRLTAAQKLEALGHMAASIAHDFNNILAGAGGYADLLRSDLALESQARADAEEIFAVVQQGQRLVGKLLRFGGHAPVSPESLDVNQVAGDIVRMLRHTIPPTITLDTAFAADLLPFAGDRSQLEQVLSNLVVNARDAMPAGGTLTVSTGTYPEANGVPMLWLAVQDTGVGMDEVTQSRIFEPFFTTKSANGGTGLGLATVHGIVTRVGGNLLVESALGQGTTFRVLLPVRER